MPDYSPSKTTVEKKVKEEPSLTMLVKKFKLKLSPELRKIIKSSDKLTVVKVGSKVYVFQYSASPPPRYDNMKSLKHITGKDIETITGDELQRVKDVLNKKKYTSTVQGRFYV